MKQPKNTIRMTDDRRNGYDECSVTIEENTGVDLGFAWIAIGRTPLAAHRAASDRLRRLLRDNNKIVEKLAKEAQP